ncbi:carboxypeptidase-like regulatory domain-containing protein [Rosistilla oblonga]|uniref:carboxypeptidase-like regulatory domain-containing protein n=1 Tax=Rosistilla oblonga TaxID=2527990 RepID=UPI003A9805A8
MKLVRNCGAIVATLCVGMLVVGCGSTEQLLDVVPASGKVTVDGKPVEGISVSLLPQDGVPGRGGYGVTDATGAFTVTSVEGQDGVAEGKYKVVFQKLTQPDGSPIPPGSNAADVGAVNSLPAAYNDPDLSTMFAIIKADGTSEMEFDLNSKRKR